MKTYLDCIPCFFKQAIEASRHAGVNEKKQKKIIQGIADALIKFPLSASPPEMGRIIYGLVKKVSGNNDPYLKIKLKSNRTALKLYSKLKTKIAASKRPLLTAVELAIAGNIIDYGIKNRLDLNSELKKMLNQENKTIKKEDKKLFNYSRFKEYLKQARSILILGDNAGEIVFDRVLIEEIKKTDKDKDIFYAVKESPIINDALVQDAYQCGINKVANVISCGLDSPGTILKLCSKNFLKVYQKSDMIISKGQGNFEALSKTNCKIFFLFMAKCPVVAADVGCNIGDIILLHNQGGKRCR